MRRTLFLATFGCATLLPSQSRAADASARPHGLLTNLLSKPEKTLITTSAPKFSWIVPASTPGDIQTAYQLQVATSPTLLSDGKADLWDSGKVASAQSLHVAYSGASLQPNRTYWWTVRTWNESGEPSAFSEPQRFNTGRLDRSGERWPGESLWVRMPTEDGGETWTFEDRHPIAYHEQKPVRLIAHPDASTFIDFGKAAFSGLKLEVEWTPDPTTTESKVELAVGEKASAGGDTIDPKPGGGVIYRRYPLALLPGVQTVNVEFPRFVPKYPHSQAMPPHMPEVVPFRYAALHPTGGKLTVRSARQMALWYEFNDDAARFSSSSPELDSVYELCRYSLKVNTFNGDYASSERERMMYEADTLIQQMGHYAVDREFAIARYSVENMLYHGSWPTEWISHCLLMAWADYEHTGDASLIERHYDLLARKTMLALAREDGLISTRTGLQTKEFLAGIHAPRLTDIVDWPTHMADAFDFRDYNSVVNAFHHESLAVMSRMAGVLGRSDDQRTYAQRANLVRASFNEAFFNPARGLYRDGIGSDHHSFHANLFALRFGLVPETHRLGVIAYLRSKGMACGVYPAHYVLEAFYDNGDADHALALMTADGDRGWRNMLRMGSTVTTEAWDMKFKHNISWTHAWSASPAHIIPRKLMGIEPLEPGFSRVRVRPQLSTLTEASVRLPTIRGAIDVSVTNKPDEPYRIELTVPANVTASVSIPALDRKDDNVRINGNDVVGARSGDRIVLPELRSGFHTISRNR